ncbi:MULTISPECIES: bifunctional DNA primase/polymerase [unclassified Streptomyces]|uniref:bifunctional DNA primase/polymerase n=1 Tax=unclassified Streptomyces TaxID=2593676 RepID=UPI00081B97AE|nr:MULTISPECIES: bifunctional DNA primase/polymerase [unclassified Streptomyces]MYQ54896.1 DNA primase [Streptomyces sp. SID4941]SCE29869.1 Bifunctional DNA primase/polymerase, N-terminal [Streptomyces sp. PalvLS-984]SDC06071.1 Bifunctional DNA primase/polymerase, N-terminal [Streptomyces sp. AmelKG-A3]
MTQPVPIRRAPGVPLLATALDLAARDIPVLPLRAGKIPFGNCPACRGNACGGRPNMKTPGPCDCPRICHGWAAATTDTATLTGPAWAPVWEQAQAVAYHPGGAGLTVVDLDHTDAIAWARQCLPATCTVATTRGEHWIYQGAMQSANAVRDGVDIKSTMAYARWIGPGTGTMAALPHAVRALLVKGTPSVRTVQPAVVGSVPAGGGQCRHRTPAYLDRGIAMAVQQITEASSAVHATVYRTFLAVLAAHGRCGCLTDAHVGQLFAAAQAKGEGPRHCSDAWSNARTRLGL